MWTFWRGTFDLILCLYIGLHWIMMWSNQCWEVAELDPALRLAKIEIEYYETGWWSMIGEAGACVAGRIQGCSWEEFLGTGSSSCSFSEQTTTLTTVSSNHLEMRRRISSATDLAPLTTQPLAPQLFSLYISDTNHCIKALEPRGPRPWWISGFLCTHTKCIGSAFSELIKCTALVSSVHFISSVFSPAYAI